MSSIAVQAVNDKSQEVTAEPATAGGFTMVPNDLLERGDISPGAKLTYIGLLRFAWQEGFCFPGQERLAAMLGMGVRTVIRHLQELARAGLILLERRGRGRTNRYLFPKMCQNGRSRRAESADPEVPNLQPIKTQRDKDTETKTQSSNTRKTLHQSVSSLRGISSGQKPVPEPTPRPGPVLSLKAPASDVLRRVQRMAPVIVHDLQPTAPVPLRVIEIV
jgi:DNA-binding transcriptional ArsR family regulator